MLAGFKDVIAVDATVVKLDDGLAATWRGTRRSSARAALEVHVTCSPRLGPVEA